MRKIFGLIILAALFIALKQSVAEAQMMTCSPKKAYVLADCTRYACEDSLTLWRVTDLTNCETTLKMGETPDDLIGFFNTRINDEDVVSILDEEPQLITLSFSERCIGRNVDNDLVYTCGVSALSLDVVPQLQGDSVLDVRNEVFTMKTMASKKTNFIEGSADLVKYSTVRLFFLLLIAFSFGVMFFAMNMLSFIPALCAAFAAFCFQLILVVMLKPDKVENEDSIDFNSAQGHDYDLNADGGHPVLVALIVVGWIVSGLYFYKVKGDGIKERVKILRQMK